MCCEKIQLRKSWSRVKRVSAAHTTSNIKEFYEAGDANEPNTATLI
jgi:hypothetical protein